MMLGPRPYALYLKRHSSSRAQDMHESSGVREGSMHLDSSLLVEPLQVYNLEDPYAMFTSLWEPMYPIFYMMIPLS